MTFTEMLARWVGARSGTERGSIVADISKLDSWIAQQTLKLASSNPDERAAILNDIAACKQRRDKLFERLQALRNNPGADRGGQPILLPDSTGPGAQGASASGQFMNWLGNKHPDLLRDAKTALRQHGFDVDQIIAPSGGDPYRNQFTNPVGFNTDYAVDSIVAWIVQSPKGRWGTGKYREIYDKYLDLIDARVKEFERLKSSPAGVGWQDKFFGPDPKETGLVVLGRRPPEWDFGEWLATRDPGMFREAAKAAGGYNVDKIVRWLVQSKKYQLGVNPKYNDIFAKYIELNNTRLKEMRDLASAPPPTPPGPAQWRIDPVTLRVVPFESGASAPPAVVPIPNDPGASAPGNTTGHDEPQTLSGGPQTLPGARPIILPEVRGHVFVGRKNTDNFIEHLFASIGDKHSPQAEAFIGKLRTRLQDLQTANEPLTVEDFLGLVGRYANQEFGLVRGADIARTMAGLSTSNPNGNAVSSGPLRDDYRLDISYVLAALQ